MTTNKMKVYSDKIDSWDVGQAFTAARETDGRDIWLDGIHMFKPRKFRHGVEFWAMSLHGKVASGHRPIGSYPLSLENGSEVARAASWTSYGYVIARLYAKDPEAKIGHYGNVKDFVEKVRSYTPRGQDTEFLRLLPTCPFTGRSSKACDTHDHRNCPDLEAK